MYDRVKYTRNDYKWVLVCDPKLDGTRAIPYVNREHADQDKATLEARGYVVALLELFPPYVKGPRA